MTADYAPYPALSMTGSAILRLLAQVEEHISSRPRAVRDPRMVATLRHIRDEAAVLAELYEHVTRPGQCARCHADGVPLTGALCADPGLEVCQACELDPDVPTFPLTALADDREVWVVTRGDLAWLAGREVSDREACRLAAAIGDATCDVVAGVVGQVCGQVPLA